MNTANLNEDTLNRLVKAIMIKRSLGPNEALIFLSQLKLNLICDKTIAQSCALQAALLTAVNTGKRAFHGGVFVSMPHSVPCLLNWPGNQSLNQIVQGLGGNPVGLAHSPWTHTLYFGQPSAPVPDSFQLVCSGWRGGVIPAHARFELPDEADFALGGVLAAAFGVGRGFLRLSGLSTRTLESPQGLSLWRPDLDWTSAEAQGPTLEVLPKNLWMLGLGHLGQAYLWSIGLLPYSHSDEVRFVLQDFDRLVGGNYSSGLLCEEGNIGTHKTRVCADWVEARGFQTTLVERAFDANTKRTGDEPYIACCGFDAAEPRCLLESAGFELVVECALGADVDRFDRVILHTFPEASKAAAQIWADVPEAKLDRKLVDAFKTEGDCGILAETLARKSIATAFVGAFAGALTAGELLRAFNGGVRCELIQAHMRHDSHPGVVVKSENYMNRVARAVGAGCNGVDEHGHDGAE